MPWSAEEKLSALLDGVLLSCGLLAVFTVMAGVGVKTTFSWHPILMSLAVFVIFPIGRKVYVGGPYLRKSGPRGRGARALHMTVMLIGTVTMALGYRMVHKSNSEVNASQFGLGRPFLAPRFMHVMFGYFALLMVFSQAVFGLLKFYAVQHGRIVFTFHERLGPMVMGFGLLNAVLGTTIYTFKWKGTFIVVFLMALIVPLLGAVHSSPPGAYVEVPTGGLGPVVTLQREEPPVPLLQAERDLRRKQKFEIPNPVRAA
jgi:hypothetical protein